MPTSSSFYPDVTHYQDGQRLDAATMNGPVTDLERRTDWLHSRLTELSGNQVGSSLRLSGVELKDDDYDVGDCVYFNPFTGLFQKAIAKVLMHSNPYGISTFGSYAVGLLAEENESGDEAHSRGTVVLSGLFDFASFAQAQALMDDGSLFKSGQYYLSSKVPGKLTRNPAGPAIYIGTFVSNESNTDSVAKHGNYALLAPQYKDISEMHHHRAFALASRLISFPANDGGSPEFKLCFTGSYSRTIDMLLSFSLVNSQGNTSFDDSWTSDGESGPSSIRMKCKLDLVDDSSHTINYYSPLHYQKNGADSYCTFEIPYLGLQGVLLVGESDGPPNNVHFDDIRTSDLPGWTPVLSGDPKYGEYAYKYEIGLDPDLNKFWPPAPMNGCSFVLNGYELPSVNLHGDAGMYLADETGLYWKSDIEGARPFPDSLAPSVTSTFYLSRGKLPSSSFVTSIKAAKGSGIKIREEGTTHSASTGNLVIDAQIPIERQDPGLSGYMVPKDVVNNKLLFGPVVSSIRAGTPGLSISSMQGGNSGYGDVTISLDSSYASSGAFDDIVLHNAKQELIKSFPYIKLLRADSIASGFTMKMHVPISLNDVQVLHDGTRQRIAYKLALCMSVFGLDDASNSEKTAAAAINLQAHVLQDWYPNMLDTESFKSTLQTGVTTIGGPNDIYAIPFGSIGEDYTAFDPIFVCNAGFLPDSSLVAWKHIPLQILDSTPTVQLTIGNLHPNASVAVTVSRILFDDASGDLGSSYSNYVGELGFMNMSWKLVPDDASTYVPLSETNS